MPIYAYRCTACGFAKDVLQKMSDPVLTDCPTCGKPEFKKQVTAAGFQLKGSGWYVTDFKGGSAGSSAAATDVKKSDSESGATPAPATGTGTGTTNSDSGSTSSGSTSSGTPPPAAAPSTPTK